MLPIYICELHVDIRVRSNALVGLCARKSTGLDTLDRRTDSVRRYCDIVVDAPNLGRNWSGILELRENHRLISQGPYRYIRHPMYTALLILSVGMALITANLLLALLLIGTTMAMYLARVADEEAMMIERFGDEYHSYMRRTGRLFPRLRAE